MSDVTATSQRSSWAVGWTYFASIMMILIGAFHAMAGLIAILDDQFYVKTQNYVFQFDTTQWGWIHLIFGVLIAVAGGYLLTGSVFARTIGVIMAFISAIVGFAWMPYYPIWGVIFVAISVSVIWALTAHGRDVTEYWRTRIPVARHARRSRRNKPMSIGPIQAFVIGFPDNDLFEGRIAEELARLSDVGQIRIIDAVFVVSEDDDVAVLSVSDLSDDQRTELRAAVGALVGLGIAGGEGADAGADAGASVDPDAATAAERVALSLVDDLPDGTSALVLAIEHLWAIPLRDAVRDAGGIVIGHNTLTPEELVVFGMDVGDALADDES